MTVRPTASQRRLLLCLAAGDLIRLPAWSSRIQLIATSGQTGSVPTPTYRVLLRHGWIERTSGPDAQVPTFRLSSAGQRLLTSIEGGADVVPGANTPGAGPPE